MANLLITGASGGIGQHLCQHLSTRHEVIPLSRRPPDDSLFGPSDLVTESPVLRGHVDSQNAGNIDWIIHLATTYDINDDLVMLNNLVKFAQQHEVKNFLYVSSWVVHFPRRRLAASYIEMKRQCEQRLLQSGISNVRIIRPSVVVGPGLSWTRILKRLAPFAALIPAGFSRSFVTIDEVNACIDNVISGQSESVVVTCLGKRMSLAAKARDYRSPNTQLISWSIGLALVVTILAGVFLAGPQQRRVFRMGASRTSGRRARKRLSSFNLGSRPPRKRLPRATRNRFLGGGTRAAQPLRGKRGIKGEEPSFKASSFGHRSCWQMHRSTRVREIASAHASQNLGPDFEKTAPKLRTDRGVITEAAEQDFFVRCVGPTCRTKDLSKMRSVISTDAPKHGRSAFVTVC